MGELDNNPYEIILQRISEDKYIKQFIREKYSHKPFVLVIGPPKSGTTWLHQTIFVKSQNIGIHKTKDTEILQGLVSPNGAKLQRTARTFVNKFHSRYSHILKTGENFGRGGISSFLEPMCAVLSTIEYMNLYSFLLSPYVMLQTRRKCDGFFYVDVSLCLCTLEQLKRIKQLLLSIGIDCVKILYICREPVDRFMSHIAHNFKISLPMRLKGQDAKNKLINVTELIENHSQYMILRAENKIDKSVSHHTWLKENKKTQETFDLLQSLNIGESTIFDEVFLASKLKNHHERFTHVFGENNVFPIDYKSMFSIEGLHSLMKKVGFPEKNLDLIGLNFHEKIGEGKYQFNEKYKDQLRILLEDEIAFAKEILEKR